MKGLFGPDSILMKFFTTFFHLVVLNFFTLLLCIPVVTAGAAFTALHYMMLKIVRDEESYIVKGYFKSFKENFKQATLLWLPIAVFFFAALFDTYFMRSQPQYASKPVAIFLVVGFIIVLFVTMWAFPLLSHFCYDSVADVFKNSFLLSISHFPRTCLMALMTIAPLILVYFKPYQSLSFVVILGISLPAWGCAYLYSSVFKAMEPDDEEDEIEESAKVIENLDKKSASEDTDKKN